MRISELYKQKKPVVSLEIFPPKKDKGPESILDTLKAMTDLRPDFISVTYSAGGSGGSDVTLDIASMIKNQYGVEALPHMTCIQSTPEAVCSRLDQFADKGLENVMALRGDMPADAVLPADRRYRFASDLIADVKARYPELCMGGLPGRTYRLRQPRRKPPVLKGKGGGGRVLFRHPAFLRQRFVLPLL